MNSSRRLLAPALPVLLSLLAISPASPPARADDGTKIIPLPRRPQGPPIHRVTHDAVRPLAPGDRVEVRIAAAPDATVSASLGEEGGPIPCPERPGEKGAYTCVLIVPDGLTGRRPVVATATGEGDGVTRLSSILPVVVAARDPWKDVNALNARLAPVLFPAGSSRLEKDALATLEANLEILQGGPDLPLRVEGHCDPGEGGDHEALSLERARAVVDHLAGKGIPRDRFAPVGLAAGEPVVKDGDEEARALNRRAMILFRPASQPPES